ncbi:FAST kinase domain-containing protein 1, mitochondrial isoform X2 [Nannospalax galili]|uniref:FAST kinase domain-containing protein 1, mitochondrial isoform X2 n=1 Tax=Nannospalax galili TaxID=1026970 RepID=UPI00111C0AFC|nr:FAST kinase domain-containing protein 1, mitochondrial isoform X2 [Nannospalax galili]
MFRLRGILVSRRVFQLRPFSYESFIIQMNNCADEKQVFDLLERNKDTLSEKQVGCALNALQQIRMQKISLIRNSAPVKDHPQFLRLCKAAANRINSMNNDTLVNVLYIIRQFAVEAHDPVVEALVSEAWKRLKRFDINALSTFSTCLADQRLQFSPLMGEIADIVNKNLETIQDLRALSVLMVSISSLISQDFQERLVNKTEFLFDTVDSSKVNIARRLKSTILLMSEELTSQQTLAVLETLENMESRNSHLIAKIASVLHKHLDNYKPVDLLKITQALIFLRFQSKEFFVKLRKLLLSHLEVSFMPSEISSLVCALCILPFPDLNDMVVSRIEEVLPQCNLKELNVFAASLLRWIQYGHMCLGTTTEKQLKLLQTLDHYGHQRLQQSNSLDLLWDEFKSLRGDWFHESLVEESVAILQSFVDEISYINVAKIASFLSRTNYLSTLLLDRIASVVVQQIEKIHPLSVFAITLPFSNLNYDPPQRDEFFGACMQCLNSYVGTLDPLKLVFLAFSFATIEYFPEDLLKKIFNIEFLAKLDSQLEILSSSLRKSVLFRFMELNRAVCLECPEFQIPWFHDRFCQQQYNKDAGIMNEAKQQIYKMLAEVLGGVNYVKASAFSPYYYRVDFECILDKRKKPLPYGGHSITLGKTSGMDWELNTQRVKASLPPGAERIAFEFLDLKAFCINLPHLKGKSAMKKRHLEILGYHVIQVPYFEWNSMTMSTKAARLDYLKERIFGEGKS